MKIIRQIFGIVLLGVIWTSQLQAQSEVLTEFATQLQNGNIKAITKTFQNTLEINIEGNRQSVNKIQSENLLETFLQKYPITKFEFKHQGSAGVSDFAIAKYTSHEVSFRVVIKSNGKQIEKLDFIKE
jgi:Domain of unknown function (DUF4783)